MGKDTPKVLAIKEIQPESSENEWQTVETVWKISAFQKKNNFVNYMEEQKCDYVLVKFLGGKINATYYKIVCVMQNVLEGENEGEVISLKNQNEEKDLFKIDEYGQ